MTKQSHRIINNTIEKNNNNESKLSLKLIAEFSEKNPQKYEIFSLSNQANYKL